MARAFWRQCDARVDLPVCAVALMTTVINGVTDFGFLALARPPA